MGNKDHIKSLKEESDSFWRNPTGSRRQFLEEIFPYREVAEKIGLSRIKLSEVIQEGNKRREELAK